MRFWRLDRKAVLKRTWAPTRICLDISLDIFRHEDWSCLERWRHCTAQWHHDEMRSMLHATFLVPWESISPCHFSPKGWTSWKTWKLQDMEEIARRSRKKNWECNQFAATFLSCQRRREAVRPSAPYGFTKNLQATEDLGFAKTFCKKKPNLHPGRQSNLYQAGIVIFSGFNSKSFLWKSQTAHLDRKQRIQYLKITHFYDSKHWLQIWKTCFPHHPGPSILLFPT